MDPIKEEMDEGMKAAGSSSVAIKEEQSQEHSSKRDNSDNANTNSNNFNYASAQSSADVKQDPHTSDSEDENDDDDDDEDSQYKVAEPDYTQANKASFRSLCIKLEKVQRQRFKEKKIPKEELLKFLVPKRSYFGEGGSIFPMLRLMAPDRDTTRPRLWMKESTIANAWGDAIGLNRKSREFKKLTHYNNPQFNRSKSCGDLSMAVYEVMLQRFPETEQKKGGVTVGEMNKLLDLLAGVREDQGARWRESLQSSSQTLTMGLSQLSQLSFTQSSQLSPTPSQEESSQQSSQKSARASGKGVAKRRREWVEHLIRKRFSPLEHKWIVRIILGRMDLGIGSDTIINFIHEYAEGLYSANKNLKKLCAMLCDEEYLARKARLIQEEKDAVDNHNRNLYMPKNEEPASIYNTIDPMLSAKTKFATILSQMQVRHKAFTELLEKDDPVKSSLSLKFPPFTCEVKLDGERMLAHMKKGIVKIQTRNAKWYTQLYSPVIAPLLRRAVHPYNVDVIIDGEMLSWDDKKKETIAFGENRGIAKLRTHWLRRHGKLDSRDTDLPTEKEGDINTVPGNIFATEMGKSEYVARNDPGCDVWLKYIVFDILYLGGPDAKKVMGDAFSFLDEGARPSVTGSLLNLDLTQRKRILYTLLDPVTNMLEICETVVVRPDGTSLSGQSYFTSLEKNEFGYSPMVLDSVNLTIDGAISNLEEVDKKRREGRSDLQIDQKRANALDRVFADIVSKRQLEGLVFKDLASPYMFGPRHRNQGYWFKLKEDYEARGHAADIDVVVVGGAFAIGRRNTGLLNSFMVACLDDDSFQEGVCKYLTLGYLNGNNVTDAKLKELLATTGFIFDEQTGEVSMGSWYSSNEVPEFISKRSFQESSAGDLGGWRAQKKHRPDLWIAPEDSFVITVNSGEVVNSRDWSAGVALRFPRITAVRKEGFGASPKSPTEIESVKTLHEIYYARRAQQEVGERESQSVGGPITELEHSSLFATATEQATAKKKRKTSKADAAPSVRAPKFNQSLPTQSDIFKGKNFTVLDGKYSLDEETLDSLEAREEGWYDKAKLIRSQQDIVNFILQHGGECQLTANQNTDYIIGGKLEDPRVQNFRKSIEGITADMLDDGTKKGQHLRKIHQIGGVIKWTFVVSTVHRLQSVSNQEASNGTRVSLVPRRHDFLVMSKFADENLLKDEDIYGLHLYLDTNMVDFKRAMMEVKKLHRRQQHERGDGGSPPFKKRMKSIPQKAEKVDGATRENAPWPIQIHELFDAREKDILQTPRMKFLRLDADVNTGTSAHSGRSNRIEGMVLYPDIFQDNDFGCSKMKDAVKEGNILINSNTESETSTTRWNTIPQEYAQSEISSSLLLARAMGAQATPHLHDGVTHILCDLEVDKLKWSSRISMNAFRDTNRGQYLHRRLLQLDKSNRVDVTLVSPDWVQNQWSI